ncbi:MAG: hypothetical protein KGJ62_02200 [Armatimonadetes bacterium]|nr:hypothetical protein [Armatimonadota bacterium]MDE2205367.1 hypothetical protein [Armatimonadota bacterium]
MDNTRAYLRTHPHLTFEIDLAHARWDLWELLGEVKAKCEQLATVLLPPEDARVLNRIYLAKGVLATTAIEGNTLTEEEVSARLEGTIPRVVRY